MHSKARKIFTVVILSAVVLSTLCVDPSAVKAAPKKKQPVLANKSISLNIGKSKKLKVKHIPKKAKINYSSKNRKIATVTKKGKITAKKVGKTVIKVTVRQGKRYKKTLSCKVKVTSKNKPESKKNTTPVPSITAAPLPDSTPTVSSDTATESPVVEKEFLGKLSSDIAGAKTKTSELAVFTLELVKTDILYKNMIYLYKDGQSVGCMHDDGKDGDAIADDDIFSIKVTCYSANEIKEEYKAVCNTSVSDTVELNYFDGLSEEDFKIQEDFVESFQDLEKENTSVDGDLDTDGLLEKVYQKAAEGQSEGVVLSVSKEKEGVVIQFASGIWYVYQPEIEGVDASGSDADVSIMTLQPYQSTYDSYDQSRSTEATDGSARKIAQQFGNYRFDKNYDDSNVTLDVIKNISSNQMIFCHTHGFYNTDLGSMIWLGEKLSAAQLRSGGKYESDYLAGRIVVDKEYRAGFTAGFVTKYCGNLSNSFIYLGACMSGKDFRLAQSFINKGAKAVIANSETIWRGYNCSMMEDVANGLLQKDPHTQKYNTLQEALSYAKNKNGNNDYEWYPNNDHAPSSPLIYGEKNYRLSEHIEVNSIGLNYTNLSVNIGSSVSLDTTILPNNATDKTVTWSSSNTNVATVSNGVVTGRSAGKATITAKTSNGKTATCIVTVKNSVIEVTGISLNSTSISLEAGKSTTLIATVTPSNATDKTVTWSSSNTNVATVSNGIVTGKSEGIVTIVATTQNGKTATCNVNVYAIEDKWEGYTKIYSSEDFYNIRNNLSGKFVLMNNIDLSDYGTWMPIGDRFNDFSGILEGQGYCVKVANCAVTEYGNCGIFGAATGAIFKNLILDGNISVENGEYFCVGALVGGGHSINIDNCTNNVSITVNAQKKSYGSFSLGVSVRVGGIMGSFTGTIQNCANNGTIMVISTGGSTSGIYTGGIMGSATQGLLLKMSNCHNNGSVSAIAQSYHYGVVSGGLIGETDYDSVTLENCSNKGQVSATIKNSRELSECAAGGLIGLSWKNDVIIKDCTSIYGVADAGLGTTHVDPAVGCFGGFKVWSTY